MIPKFASMGVRNGNASRVSSSMKKSSGSKLGMADSRYSEYPCQSPVGLDSAEDNSPCDSFSNLASLHHT